MTTNHDGANILVVDDNEMNRDMLSRRLKRKNFSVLTADNGLEALEFIARHEFDLILLDINMPGINGIETLKKIRAKFSMTELPVIMVSARDQSEDIVAALQSGANDYVTKPIDFAVALARIETQLSCSRPKEDVSRCITMNGIPTLGITIGENFFHYRIENEIGKGGMGIVYKAYDTRLDRYVAVKSIIKESNERLIKRLKQEAKAIAQIKHPNIITIYDVGDNPFHYFVMEYVEGETLDEYIKKGEITLGIAMTIMQKIVEALFVAHRSGVIHRDLKPSNIIIDRDGEPHIMDFGLAKLEETDEKLTRDNEIIGTPCYMAPEQIDSKRGPIGIQTDIYAAGAIFYEMLTGRPPFQNKSNQIHETLWKVLQDIPPKPSTIVNNIPEVLDNICLKALAKEKEKRYQNAKEFEEEILKAKYSQLV